MKVIYLILLCASVVLAQKDWWQTANFYQIYPRSFYDSDNDGIGDLRGIIHKLPYLKELGVTATWLSPILKSPQADYGYDISDFYDVDEIFGTMDDLREMFRTAHELGIKIIMDFVPNHTSDKHEWFIKSVQNDPKYKDYYVWNNGKPNLEKPGERNLPPNNWQAVFKTIAWTWNDERQQYYLHQFDKGQPDLNYRNPEVVEEMKKVLTFWMDEGADGFRIDAINHLFEVADFRDEILTGSITDPTDYGYTYHNYTKDLDETYDMVREWRIMIDKYNEEHDGSTRVLFTEAYADLQQTMRYYGTKEEPISHFPFNFLLIEKLNEKSNATEFKKEIDIWFDALPEGATSNWVLGNHDKPRFGSRYGTERIDGLLTLLLLLPGVAVTYNGDEIGMLDFRYGISWNDTKDPQACNGKEDDYLWASRDPERTPFQWDASENAGFCTSCTPWLPVNTNYPTLNLASQKLAGKSFFKFYQQLSTLRTNDVFANGNFSSYDFNSDVFGFKRTYNNVTHVVIINFSRFRHMININDMNVNYPEHTEVVIAGSRSSLDAGAVLPTNIFTLGPYDAFVLQPKPADPETTTTTSAPTTTTPAASSTIISSLFVFFSSLFLNFLFN